MRIIDGEEWYSKREVQNIVSNAVNLAELCGQYGFETEVQIPQLSVMPGALQVKIRILSLMRKGLSLDQQRELEPPPGFYRPRRGDRQVARDHENGNRR